MMSKSVIVDTHDIREQWVGRPRIDGVSVIDREVNGSIDVVRAIDFVG